MVTVNYMKKIVILTSVILVALIVYLVVSKQGDVRTDGNQANVISNIFGKNKQPSNANIQILQTSTGRPPITPVIDRFKGNDPSKVQEIFIDGLKRKVPPTPVPR